MRSLLVAAALATVCVAPVALAQPGGDVTANREAARALAQRGFELFNQGKLDEALDHFTKAEERFHAPVHTLFIARCHAKAGRLVLARETFQKTVNEKLANYAPDAFREAQGEARTELEQIKKRIPTLAIDVTGTPAEQVTITVDGKLPTGNPAALEVDPGEHTVVGTPASGAPVTQRVTVREGEVGKVTLAVGGGPAPEPEIAPLPQPDTTPASGKPNVPAIAALAVGGVGLGVGAVTGILSLSKVSSVKDQCQGTQCPASLQGDADSAKTLGTVSTIAFVIGGVAAAAGVVLFVVNPGAKKTEPAAARASRWIGAEVGPGSVRVVGAF